MEKWQKDEVLTALDKATIDYAKINFCDVARSLGYKYINTIDVITLTNKFLAKHPTYSPVRHVADINHIMPWESWFATLVFYEYLDGDSDEDEYDGDDEL